MQCVGPDIPKIGIHPLCTCIPNGNVVSNAILKAANPVPDTLNLFGSVVHGNIKQAYSSLGALVLKNSCVACAAALHLYASRQDRGTIEELIGRGWLTYVTGEPVLFVVGARGTNSRAISLSSPQAPQIPPTAAQRGEKTYRIKGANCAVVMTTKSQVTVGWVNPPTLVSVRTDAATTFPNVDLRAGDIIEVTSRDACKVSPAGVTHVRTVRFSYEYPSVVPGLQTQMKYFLTGKLL